MARLEIGAPRRRLRPPGLARLEIGAPRCGLPLGEVVLPIGRLLGNVDFSGLFINTLIDFVIVSFCIFMITKIAMKPAPPGAATKACPQCGEQILAVARKCKFCTSAL